MSTTGIERPIELAPERVRQLLTARHGELELPMTPQPVLVAETRAALCGALVQLGYLADVMSDVELIAHGFDEGVLPSMRCPYGRGGDVLWARERWAQVGQGYRYFPFERAARGDDWLWHEPQRMPRDAARLVMQIRRVSVGQDASGALVWRVEVEVCR